MVSAVPSPSESCLTPELLLLSPQCRGVSTPGRGRSAAAQMLRLRADLRSEATEATMGADEIAGDARKSAGGISLRRRRRHPAGPGISAAEQRTCDRLVPHHDAADRLTAADQGARGSAATGRGRSVETNREHQALIV